MTKATVTKIFIRGVLAATAGSILGIAAVWIGITNGVFVMSGPDIVGLRESALTWSLLGLGIVGALGIAAGMIAGVVAWIGALLNLSQLERKTWFVALLLLGMVNLGIFGMIAYLIVGPDGTTATPLRRVHAPAGA